MKSNTGLSGTYNLYAPELCFLSHSLCEITNHLALRLIHVKVNRVRANGEGMGCTQREPQQPCSIQPQGVTANNYFHLESSKPSIV